MHGRTDLNRYERDPRKSWTGLEHFLVRMGIELRQKTVEAALTERSGMGYLTTLKMTKEIGFRCILRIGYRHES